MKEAQIEGGRIKYHDYGSGQAIVFLHGALSNGNTWRKVLPLLAHQFRCIAPDLPFGGHSVPLNADTNLNPTGISTLLKQFIDTLELDNIILVGNDTGGAYAQIFATTYPDTISQLILCNTDAFEVFPPKTFSLLKQGVKIPGFTWLMAQAFRFKPLLKTSLVLGLLSHTLSKKELSELYVHHFIHQKGVREDFIKVVNGWSTDYTLLAAEKLVNFQKPVLVIWGADDTKLFPLELGQRVYCIFPKAHFKVINHSLTYVQEDQPEAFVNGLLDFLHPQAI
ncbi:alpha/beta fold hydrolase [Paenibacillus sp. L3-i20]|uniref:alpha/beta fold hydrolase n=1 Tax=Paenibacillus sp. L3-i20 TaxID=2905833 RepID=UPI001EE090B5|nr:alpha/beta hydrolase [Paenibacillus sp. L3-i20]GKU80099.1 alpha/beta hydrolase [Paenibacillus sp. L3-i20]